jgi:hypothetical protein
VHASHASAPVKHRRDTKSRVRDSGAHADGLAHHATALIAAAPPLTAPLPIDRRPIILTSERIQILVSSTVPEAAARGPPVRAS